MTWVLYGLALTACLVVIAVLFRTPRRLLIPRRRRRSPKE